MNTKRILIAALTAAVLILPSVRDACADLTPTEMFGKELFFDKSLSDPSRQACATCHAERVGFTGPVASINMKGAVYPGAVPQRFGNRRPPTAAYGGESPVFSYDEEAGLFAGGMFWDGRATGWVTGDPLADQAMGPFLNPVEQNLASETEACLKVASSPYAAMYEDAFGIPLDCATFDEDGHLRAYKDFARAVAAFERSPAVSPFTSKFDAVTAGADRFTPTEEAGWNLFNGKAQCAACHPAPLFTDFTYDNLGVPRNPLNPFYSMDQVYLDNGSPINPQGADWIDPGLAGFLDTLPAEVFAGWGLDKAAAVSENYGKHKVPTLRNVDLRPGEGFAKAYMHNGALKTLEEVVAFYDERDAMIASGTVVPEVWENMNTSELGNLGLTSDEEAALVAFLKTLSDR